MTRDHIEFIQSQCLAWQTDKNFPEIEAKVLSEDTDSGACTVLHRLKSGQHWPDNLPLTANEEFYVLAGTFHLNGFEYAPGCYAFLPAGYPRKQFLVMEDSVVLRMFDCKPEAFTEDRK